jgi:hypothetical protein
MRAVTWACSSGVELVEGFEFEAEVGYCGASVVLVEQERVSAGVQGEGEGT